MNVAAEQYFGFIVSNPNGTHDIRVDQRSAERHVVAEFHRLVEVIKRLNPLAIVYAACEADFESLVQWPKDEEARLRAADGLNIPIAVVSDLMVESVRRVNAYLAAASSLIGQATIHVTKHFGAESEFTKAWDLRRQELHGGSLGYRVVYDLRNYAQHYALPIGVVNVAGQRDPGGEMILDCSARLDRDALLNSGFNWKKRTEDIAALEAEFDVLPLAEDYQRCLRLLIGEIVGVNGQPLIACVEYLRAVRRVLSAPPNSRIWLFNGPGEEGQPPTSGLIVPEEQVTWLITQFRTALKED